MRKFDFIFEIPTQIKRMYNLNDFLGIIKIN